MRIHKPTALKVGITEFMLVVLAFVVLSFLLQN